MKPFSGRAFDSVCARLVSISQLDLSPTGRAVVRVGLLPQSPNDEGKQMHCHLSPFFQAPTDEWS